MKRTFILLALMAFASLSQAQVYYVHTNPTPFDGDIFLGLNGGLGFGTPQFTLMNDNGWGKNTPIVSTVESSPSPAVSLSLDGSAGVGQHFGAGPLISVTAAKNAWSADFNWKNAMRHLEYSNTSLDFAIGYSFDFRALDDQLRIALSVGPMFSWYLKEELQYGKDVNSLEAKNADDLTGFDLSLFAGLSAFYCITDNFYVSLRAKYAAYTFDIHDEYSTTAVLDMNTVTDLDVLKFRSGVSSNLQVLLGIGCFIEGKR